MLRQASIGCAIALLLAAAGATAEAGETCLPQGIALNAASARTDVPEEPRRGAAAAYLDESTSMKGFVQSKAGQPATYADTILGLRAALEQVAADTAFYRFGRQIQSLPTTELTAAARPTTYDCDLSGRNKIKSNNCDSRIDNVLDAVAKSPADTLSLIATDLFLGNRDMVGSEYGTMRNSIESILLSGKSIGILGVSAPFYGIIYDIPGHKPYRHQGVRPYFLLIVGSDDAQILKLKRVIETELLGGIPAEDHPFALFTLHPAREATSTAPLQFDANEPQQFDGRWFGAGAPPAAVVIGKNAAPKARLAFAKRLEPFTAPMGGFAVASALWVYRDAARCQARWLSWQQPGLLSIQGDDDNPVLAFDPKAARDLPRQTFLLRATVRATRIGRSQQLDWLHDWGFGEAQAATVIKNKPKLFPVLNLGQLADTLAGIIQNDFKSITVGDYLIVFRKGN